MSTLENELNMTPESVRQVAEELNSVGKFKYYPLRRIGSTNAPRYYPRGVARSTLRLVYLYKSLLRVGQTA
jgi:hypothetical protein